LHLKSKRSEPVAKRLRAELYGRVGLIEDPTQWNKAMDLTLKANILRWHA
jgi:hypothetical protein